MFLSSSTKTIPPLPTRLAGLLIKAGVSNPRQIGGRRPSLHKQFIPLRAQIHLHAGQVLDARDARAVLADAQSHPGGFSHLVGYFGAEGHVGAIGSGDHEYLAVASHSAIRGSELNQHGFLRRLDHPGYDHRATLDQMVGRWLPDDDRLAQPTAGGDVAHAHGEQDQVERIDRYRSIELVKHAQAQLPKFRHPSQLEIDRNIQVDPIHRVAGQPFVVPEQQPGFPTRLEWLDPDFHIITPRGDGVQVSDQI